MTMTPRLHSDEYTIFFAAPRDLYSEIMAMAVARNKRLLQTADLSEFNGVGCGQRTSGVGWVSSVGAVLGN